MPIGTVSIATLLYLRELAGSIAFAGAAVGTWFVAAALVAPVQGRVIDRRGPRLVLLVTGVISPLALLLVLFARELRLPDTAILGVLALAGASAPPVTVVLRTVWRHRFSDEHARRTAYAIDGVLLEIAYTIGPAVVAAIVAAASARAAFALAWVCVASAVPVFLASGGLRWWHATPAEPRELLGPLGDRRLVRVYVVTFFLVMAFGSLEVGYPTFASAQGTIAWGPAFVAINSVGSALGGVIYGGMRLAASVHRQLPWLIALFAAPAAVHAVLTSIPAMAIWAFIAGLLIAPSMAAVTVLVSTLSPPRYATEAFTWSSTAIVSGIGAGMAISGALAEDVGAWAAFAFGGAAAFAGSVLALGISRLGE